MVMLAQLTLGKNIVNSKMICRDDTTKDEGFLNEVENTADKVAECTSFEPLPTRIHLPSSSLRITCKARGLSRGHNADNAYIEIPSDAPHGMPLFCSHPECASSGRKFRYCKGEKKWMN